MSDSVMSLRASVMMMMMMMITGAESYRQHGYRLLLIWLHCQLLSGSDVTQMSSQMYDALHDINRSRHAGQTHVMMMMMTMIQ